MKHAVLKNLRPQSAAELRFHKGFSPGGYGAVHPMTGFALLASLEEDSLKDKAFAKAGPEIESFNNQVSPEDGGWQLGELEEVPYLLQGFEIEESDLTFV